MKSTTNPRTSTSSDYSRTTLDVPHLNSDLHHTNHHHENDTDNEVPKDSLYALSDNPSGPIQMYPLKPDEGYSDNDVVEGHKEGQFSLPDEGYSDNDLKKGHEIIQLPDEAALEDMDYGWTCTWDDLPQWMKDNPAIISGYRRATYSYHKCIKTLWFIHNETVNIWSHLVGAIAFIIIAPVTYYKILEVHPLIKWSDIGVVYAFLAGAIVCLSMSASFHTFSCHSEKVCSQWIRCDYLGIIFLIVGSCYPPIYYGFYCEQYLQIIYISVITVLGSATIIAVMRPKFQIPQFRWVRSVLFVALGLSGLAPIVHSIVIYGYTLAQQAAGLNFLFSMGAAYLVGVFIYATRTPECFFPGKFDNFGASHQIFHICVLIGCTIHFLGVIQALNFWHDHNPQCTISMSDMRVMYG